LQRKHLSKRPDRTLLSGADPVPMRRLRQSSGFRAAIPVVIGFLVGLGACAPMVPPDRVALTPVDFQDLPGWRKDKIHEAAAALARSCLVLAKKPAAAAIGPHGFAGRAADWRVPCRAIGAQARLRNDADGARRFFERYFRAYAVRGAEGHDGLFTGYFEITLKGSRRPTARYNVPLYARPPDLVMADLGTFSSAFRGRSIAGRVERGRLIPYADRAAIEKGALVGRGLELAWVDDPVDAFFLEIQGSGRVRLEDGSVMRVGYAGKNGHAYTAIGRVLVDMGALKLEAVTMGSIRAWLAANPARARAVLTKNRSFVFFREIQGPGPIGAEGVALSTGRSLAVDRKFLPLGVPLFVAADDPAGRLAPVRRLMVAQDTGGAIRGPVRGDIFFGHGAQAAATAGQARLRGRYWILLPVSVPQPQLAGQ
jgi:membrane-bound lytic murein transglycosylase A